MNMNIIQMHTKESLVSLAQTCVNNKRTPQSDEIVVKVLSDSHMNVENCLDYIAKIDEIHQDLSDENEWHVEVDLVARYAYDLQSKDQADEIWQGLQGIAASISQNPENERQDPAVLEFIYNSLSQFKKPEAYKSIMQQIPIVKHLTRRSAGCRV